tara:strand:+ start:3792 stop:5480 length:1689 start_codon:yes stop_codon:yes gene_type:complete
MILNEINKIKIILGDRNVKRFYFLIPFDILTSLLEILSISVIIPFIIAISDKRRVLDSEYSYLVKNNFTDYNEFVFFAGCFLIIVLFVSSLLSIFSQYKLVKLANEIGQETSQLLFEKYLYSPYKFHLSTNSSELTKVLTSEVSRFTQNVLIASLKLISKSIFLIIIVVFMLLVDPLISVLIICFLLTVYFLIYKSFKNRLFSNGIKISNSIKFIYKIINESLIGIKETKFYSLEEYYYNSFKKNSDTIASSTASSQIRSLIPKNIIEFLVLTALILIINYLNSKELLISSLPIITFYLYSAYRALPALQQVYNSSALIKSNFESVNQIIKYNEVEIEKPIEKSKKNKSVNSIVLRKINFGYSNDLIFLKDFNLNLKQFGFIGIIGKSGSGKSSLIDLLLKLIEPISGELKINNLKYNYQDARSLFAYVPQDINLSDSSIIENIRLGNIGSPLNSNLIKESYILSGLNDLITSLPNGLESQIGENGSLLSGGQRKRLGLARAIYSQKPILILDEVTSGLDRQTELSILQDLKKMSKSKLIILVTHNSEDLKYFDKIVDLDKL